MMTNWPCLPPLAETHVFSPGAWVASCATKTLRSLILYSSCENLNSCRWLNSDCEPIDKPCVVGGSNQRRVAGGIHLPGVDVEGRPRNVGSHQVWVYARGGGAVHVDHAEQNRR